MAALITQSWLSLKLAVVFGLAWYQLICFKIIKKLECDQLKWTAFKMRLFNELPVLFLLVGILAAVFKF
jgi:putative membrane protein